MLNISNILAFVGGGDYPKFSPNKIIIWDDHQGKIVSQARHLKNTILQDGIQIKTIKAKR